jgi:hypothetical protein
VDAHFHSVKVFIIQKSWRLHFAETFMARFGLGQASLQVSRHHPADFLVTILDRDVFEEVANINSSPPRRPAVPAAQVVASGPSYPSGDEVLCQALP